VRREVLPSIHEQLGVDAVHDAAQPIGARNAIVKLGKAAQEGEVRVAPIDDVVVVVAARDRAAHHQEQYLAQRIHDLPGLPRIRDLSEVIEQRTQAWPR
jgi:hypothetical protein